MNLFTHQLKTNKMQKTKITSFRDLDVYKRSYNACLIIMKEIVPNLPHSEKYDLSSQLSRSSKAVPRLISEGYAKKHQAKGFQKYLDDALAESNETEVGLCQCRDIYPHKVNPTLCESLIEEYQIISKQTFKLRQKWTNFTEYKYNSPNS